jgi:hypothetical protein
MDTVLVDRRVAFVLVSAFLGSVAYKAWWRRIYQIKTCLYDVQLVGKPREGGKVYGTAVVCGGRCVGRSTKCSIRG